MPFHAVVVSISGYDILFKSILGHCVDVLGIYDFGKQEVPPNCNFVFELHEKPLWPADPITEFFKKK